MCSDDRYACAVWQLVWSMGVLHLFLTVTMAVNYLVHDLPMVLKQATDMAHRRAPKLEDVPAKDGAKTAEPRRRRMSLMGAEQKSVQQPSLASRMPPVPEVEDQSDYSYVRTDASVPSAKVVQIAHDRSEQDRAGADGGVWMCVGAALALRAETGRDWLVPDGAVHHVAARRDRLPALLRLLSARLLPQVTTERINLMLAAPRRAMCAWHGGVCSLQSGGVR